MARGRKRLVAGWGMIGLGVVVAMVVLASRWWYTWTGNLAHCRIGVCKGRGWVHIATDVEDPGGIARTDPAGLLWVLSGEWSEGDKLIDTRLLFVYRPDHFQGSDSWKIHLLLWPIAPAAFAGGVPLVLSARKVRRRARLGQCPSCGYALAGLAPGAACPECGKAR